ncbi:RING-type E3 ubiquitin transferase [Sarracenia purpurea var. burkii]
MGISTFHVKPIVLTGFAVIAFSKFGIMGQPFSHIERYNRHFGARSNGLIQRLRDLPFLLKRLLREILNPQRSIPFAIRARVCLAILASALYIISPVDIIPEAIFGIIGFVDDALIAVIGFLHVAALYRSVLLSRYGGS